MKRSDTALYVYAGVIATAGCLLFASLVRHGLDPAAYSSVHFWLLAIAVVVGEFVHIKVPHKKETVSVTVGDPFTLSLLLIFGLTSVALVKVTATLLEDVKRGQVWWKILFNVGQYTISLWMGNAVIGLFGYEHIVGRGLDARGVAVSLLSAGVYFLFNMSIVTTAISLAIGSSPVTTFKSNLLETGVIQQIALTGFTPVVASATHDSAALFPLLLIPIAVVYHSGTLVQRHVTLADQLRELYETTRVTSAKVDSRESAKHVLERVCSMFSASRAAITLFPREGEETSFRTTLDLEEGSFTLMEPTTPDATQGVWARAASENKAILLSHPIDNTHLQAFYESAGVKDLMVAPMHSEERVNGVIEVFNRIGEGQTFTTEDLRLFETLANHASISLENARLINELEESLEHLTEMNRLKDDFVASVSHELRTPLTSIQGYVKTLLRPDAKFEPDQQRAFLETVDRQSNRLYRLIEDLLAVSRIESNTDATMKTIVSLRQVTEEVIDEVRGRIKEPLVELDFEEELLVETDGGKVHQIFSNLVDNALKYGGKDSMVRVHGRRDGDGAVVSVADEGSGVPEDLQDRIFDRFYQVDQSATRAVGGAGLGLYICRRLAEAIGGRVWLERTGPSGSVFSVWIPTSTPGATVQSVSQASANRPSDWKI